MGKKRKKDSSSYARAREKTDETSIPAAGPAETPAVPVKLSVMAMTGDMILEDEVGAALRIADLKLLWRTHLASK